MELKTKIGQRLKTARKQMGITVKELAAMTVDLKPSRIANWEQGTRSPGPMEAKQLSQALNVAPAYLLCLTDDEDSFVAYQGTIVTPVIPLIELETVALHSSIQKAIDAHEASDTNVVPIPRALANKIGAKAFVTRLVDNSMSPEFREGDLVIIDPNTKPMPSNFVLAKTATKEIPLLRKYRENGVDDKGKPVYELEALHRDWSSTQIGGKVKVIGTLVTLYRKYL